MASVYLDTSALIKLYIEEEGTARVIALTEHIDSAQVIISDDWRRVTAGTFHAFHNAWITSVVISTDTHSGTPFS